ncbi:MAG: hypothetical protein PHI12_11440 [Dehalococcoidales bacterium]|nr:hypothetical protein [Dehalococcoidales bacterium]
MIKNRFRFLSIMNFIGFLGTIVINALANILPINNNTTGGLSDRYPNLFVPAGFTFSIWGVIYVLLGIFVIYHLIMAIKKKDVSKNSSIERIGVLFFITCLANAGWIFAWHYEILPLSLILMLILLGCLIMIYLRLNIGKSDVTKNEKYLVHVPFSVYLGWITVATIANITALLVDMNWGAFGLGEQFWAVAVIVVALAITLAMLFSRRDVFYGIVVDWALFGILMKRLAVEGPTDQNVVLISIVGLVVITTVIIVQVVRKKAYHIGQTESL